MRAAGRLVERLDLQVGDGLRGRLEAAARAETVLQLRGLTRTEPNLLTVTEITDKHTASVSTHYSTLGTIHIAQDDFDWLLGRWLSSVTSE